MKDSREINVGFYEESSRKAFDALKSGKYEDKQLYKLLDNAIDEIKKNPFIGVKIPKKLWPLDYTKKYPINNLHKYDLVNGWRIIYTVQADSVQILAIVLEWFNHSDYEKRFKY